MATTLLLDRDDWDLAIDASGNIALASEPYAQVQDAASACKVFEGEAWYDTTLGVPYFQQVFRGAQPVQVLKARMVLAAQSVPGVTAATVVLTELTDRTLGGQLQVRTDDGAVVTARI
jgi:hypothetical protein